MSDPSEPSLEPAESRAVELLRRQRAVAVPMRALGGLVAAIATALAGAVRSGRGQGRP